MYSVSAPDGSERDPAHSLRRGQRRQFARYDIDHLRLDKGDLIECDAGLWTVSRTKLSLGATGATIDDRFTGTGSGGNESPCATGNGD